MVHGLCLNDRHWRRDEHDHGAALADDLGLTPLYLRYNTGLHIGDNGRDFAKMLETLLRNWPRPVEELVILGHSMGGSSPAVPATTLARPATSGRDGCARSSSLGRRTTGRRSSEAVTGSITCSR